MLSDDDDRGDDHFGLFATDQDRADIRTLAPLDAPGLSMTAVYDPDYHHQETLIAEQNGNEIEIRIGKLEIVISRKPETEGS